MTFVRANPPGWALFELLTSSQMNTIDSQMPFALDGAGGGTYIPTATLEIDGSALGPVIPTMILHASPSGYGLTIQADETAATTGGMSVLVTGNAIGAVVGSVAVQSSASAPNNMLVVSGHENDNTDGGDAIFATGGVGGPAGDGGDGGVFTGGAGNAVGTSEGGNGITAIGGVATTSTTAAGIGVRGTGGATEGGSDDWQAAGVYGVGGGSTGANQAGHGVVGLGGTGTTAIASGDGGFFTGGPTQDGVVGTGGAGGGTGVQGFGAGDVGVRGLGDTIFAGASFDGGTTSGVGVVAQGGGTTGVGARFLGRSSAVPLEVQIDAGSSNDVAIDSDGAIDFNSGDAAATNPASTVAMLNKLHGKNVVKAWGHVSDGIIQDGFNITSVAINGTDSTYLDVTFAQAMANATYIVLAACTTGHGVFANLPRFQCLNVIDNVAPATVPTTTTFQLRQFTWTGATIATRTQSDGEAFFFVLGQQ